MVTAVKDYVEIVHKLVETDSLNINMESVLTSYSNFGAIVTYSVLLIKQFLIDIFSFNWLQSIYSFPVIVPNIASAMISEISVFDGYFHNAFTFLETPISYGNQNVIFYCLEKFSIGILNSLFLFLPTSTAHLICLRRFVMQGLEAGYIAGLGTIAGNIVWIGSLTFGLRFFMIPWLSLDILRYILGFLLLVKYMWDSYSEKRVVLEDLSKQKIFLLNFLLTFTEQSNIYPFISNLSFGSDSTFVESFPTETFGEFLGIHGSYLFGIFLGSFSLLQFTCWFWENPAFRIYMWMVSSFKLTTGVYSKVFNFIFLYLTMICAISSVSYFGIDYTITNPLGFVHEDRLLDQKSLLETSFLNTKASDRNTRRNRGRHGRRERWKRRVRRYRTFDASLYDQGVYDLFTIEDLNYGFDRFWLRRKMRNHRVHFRFFPGPWMRSFKKQLSRPRLESFMGPRVEFFRILFEQVYHPEFHEFKKNRKISSINITKGEEVSAVLANQNSQQNFSILPGSLNRTEKRGPSSFSSLNFTGKDQENQNQSIYAQTTIKTPKQGLVKEYSALRKFIRKVNNRVKSSSIATEFQQKPSFLPSSSVPSSAEGMEAIYSKRWKYMFSKMSHEFIDQKQRSQENLFRRLYNNVLLRKNNGNSSFSVFDSSKKQESLENLSKKDRQILRYKAFLKENVPNKEMSLFQQNKRDNSNQKSSKQIETLSATQPVWGNEMNSGSNFTSSSAQNEKTTERRSESSNSEGFKAFTLFHPIQFYLKKEQAFQKRLKFYGANVYRSFGVENNAPYFRTMMQRFFYYYKPTLRWERTMRTATMRKARRKGPRVVRKQNIRQKTKGVALMDEEIPQSSTENFVQKPTHFYSLVSKRATRYRSQIYKDVLQHWYYSPFNRLLLKFDVDSFIRRQPNSYFLTKKEEQLLHLRRFLLSEHYETLRWYTYMQHYRTMKAKIGGTKSFASRMYSQQFLGTFKKVRHLFAMTPSSLSAENENSILRFDQPLYNEYKNTKTNSILAESLFHEELLADDDIFVLSPNEKEFKQSSTNGADFTDQSKNVIRKYLVDSTPLREEIIQKLLAENNYWELTKFLFKGQKLRGSGPVTNEQDFLSQEKQYLLNGMSTSKQEQKDIVMVNSFTSMESSKIKEIQENLWIEFLKKCQNTLYDQESLKNYLVKHFEKRNKQQQRQENYLNRRFERLKNWFLDKTKYSNIPNEQGVTTAVQKGVKESILFQKNPETMLLKSNLRNNMPKLNLFKNEKSEKDSNFSAQKVGKFHSQFKVHLDKRIQTKQLEVFEIENRLKQVLKSSLNKDKRSSDFAEIQKNQKESKILSTFYKTITPFTYLSKQTFQTIFTKPLIVLKKIRNSAFGYENSEPNSKQTWRKQEIALSKRKKTRKTLKRLKNTNQKTLTSDSTTLSVLLNQRQKRDSMNENEKRIQSWNEWKNQENSGGSKSLSGPHGIKEQISTFAEQYTTQKFKRKRTRLRRYRRFKNRGPIKKRTLGEKLKRQFKLLKRYSRSSASDDVAKPGTQDAKRVDKKMEIFKMITKRNYDPNSEFLPRETKQRRIRQNKQRVWKEKKQRFAQNKRKQRKRRRHAAGQIRNLLKDYKRKEATLKIQQWWWQHFLPNFKTTVEKNWKTGMKFSPDDVWGGISDAANKENISTKQWKDEFLKFSSNEILKRDSIFSRNQNLSQKLQIGDRDYKPLATPEAIRIALSLSSSASSANEEKEMERKQFETSVEKLEQEKNSSSKLFEMENQNKNFISQMTKNTLTKQTQFAESNGDFYQNFATNEGIRGKPQLSNQSKVNPMPFYAGWDESLRKFVITNRFLSIQNQQTNFTSTDENNTFFTAPLKGMNAATTLYWQVPFTTYDPDQFFALGMDGFSPIGWRRFHFRHSKQTTKPILVKSKTNFTQNSSLSVLAQKGNQEKENFSLSYNVQEKILQSKALSQIHSNQNETTKNQLRRSQKRYKRVKKHPRPPVWFPSGPLTNQVLPVHYIYVFYKRYRLPRDRYIRRRLRKNNQTPAFSGSSNETKGQNQLFTQMTDFTLRKRVKPRRKYHRKRHFYKNENFILRRKAFREQMNDSTFNKFSSSSDLERDRPAPPNFVNIARSSQFDMKQKRKLNAKQSTANRNENVRIRQLRRRVQRQVIRPVLRYKPKAGGFTWPGDYLRFELVKAPILATSTNTALDTNRQTKSRKTKKKKRKAIQEWQIQPKKYLLQKHNLRVLRKRLQKSQNASIQF
jgi:hypothetical protein